MVSTTQVPNDRVMGVLSGRLVARYKFCLSVIFSLTYNFSVTLSASQAANSFSNKGAFMSSTEKPGTCSSVKATVYPSLDPLGIIVYLDDAVLLLLDGAVLSYLPLY